MKQNTEVYAETARSCTPWNPDQQIPSCLIVLASIKESYRGKQNQPAVRKKRSGILKIVMHNDLETAEPVQQL